LQLHESKLQFLLLCSVKDCCRTHNPGIQGMFSFVVLVPAPFVVLVWHGEIFSDYISRNFQDGSWPSAPTLLHRILKKTWLRIGSKNSKENTNVWLLIWKEIFGLGSNFFFLFFFPPLYGKPPIHFFGILRRSGLRPMSSSISITCN